MKPYLQEKLQGPLFLKFYYFFLTFLLLEDNCFTISCWPLPYTNTSQSQGTYLSEKRKGHNYKDENFLWKEKNLTIKAKYTVKVVNLSCIKLVGRLKDKIEKSCIPTVSN